MWLFFAKKIFFDAPQRPWRWEGWARWNAHKPFLRFLPSIISRTVWGKDLHIASLDRVFCGDSNDIKRSYTQRINNQLQRSQYSKKSCFRDIYEFSEESPEMFHVWFRLPQNIFKWQICRLKICNIIVMILTISNSTMPKE